MDQARPARLRLVLFEPSAATRTLSKNARKEGFGDGIPRYQNKHHGVGWGSGR